MKRDERFVASKQDIKQLMYVFSHDLRNPLVNMQALLHTLDSSLSDSALDEQGLRREVKETRMVMQEVVTQMNQLIHGVNDIYHSMFDTLACERLDMEALVQGELQRRMMLEKGSDLSVSLSIRHNFWADPLVMRQMVGALLDNARAASQLDGHISIATEKRSGLDVLAVRDTGCGIGESDLKYLFQPFFSRQEGSAGMGLALVKGWAQAHGGKVWCESKLGAGSIFYIGIPERLDYKKSEEE